MCKFAFKILFVVFILKLSNSSKIPIINAAGEENKVVTEELINSICDYVCSVYCTLNEEVFTTSCNQSDSRCECEKGEQGSYLLIAPFLLMYIYRNSSRIFFARKYHHWDDHVHHHSFTTNI